MTLSLQNPILIGLFPQKFCNGRRLLNGEENALNADIFFSIFTIFHLPTHIYVLYFLLKICISFRLNTVVLILKSMHFNEINISEYHIFKQYV